MQNKEKRSKLIRKTMVIIFWIIIWALIALFAGNNLLVASPVDTAKEFLLLFLDKRFYEAVAGSMLRIASGLVAGLVLGVILASAAYKSEFISDLFMPLINVIKAIPVAAFVVMLLIWWGPKNLAFIICMLVVFPSIFFNTLEGLKATDKSLLEMAKVFKLPKRVVYSYVYKPALRPYVLSAIKVSLGMCWKSGVAAEVIGLTEGSIGERLYMSKIYFETASVFAWTVVIVIISCIFEKLIMKLTNHYFDVHVSAIKPANVHEDKNIEFKNVSKAYGDEVVINSMNVSYSSGETYYLNSPSGSGKTTILNLIAGLVTPDKGEISKSANIGMMFQTDRLLEEFDAVTNVALVTGDVNGAKEALLKVLDEEDLSKKVSQLSGGMKRRVALVRAMESDSDVVLLDEPYTGMDDKLIDSVKKYILDSQNGRTLIIATHIM